MNKIEILGVKIGSLSFKEAVNVIDGFIKDGKNCRQVTTVNPEFVVTAQTDKEFKKVINESDLSVPDGKGLEFAAKAKGTEFTERITGVDLTWALAKLAEDKGYKVFLLGAGPGVALQVANRMKLIHPQIKIAGTYAGTPDEKGLIERINKTNPDILFVAFGAPKQDKFIAKNIKKLNCKVAIGIGGTFDYISGIVDRAPIWMRRAGLEWLYRLFKQPKRIKRIFTAVIIFPTLFFLNSLKNR